MNEGTGSPTAWSADAPPMPGQSQSIGKLAEALPKASDDQDAKARSLAVARRLFPDVSLSRKKDHGKADALLLAWWARVQTNTRRPF